MELDLSYKSIKELQNLPKTLKTLYCSGNQIDVLQNLPENLQTLYCYHNQIKVIENLPENLQILDCSYNQIKVIENLPENLKELYCYNNQITIIENLPLGLIDFYGGDPILYVDNVKYTDINFTLSGYQAIRRIQKRMKRRYKIKNEASRIIGRQVLHWLWSPPKGPMVIRMIANLQAEGLLLA